MGIYFHFGTIRSHPENPTAKHGQFFAVGSSSIVESKITYCNIYPSIDSHSYTIGGMIGSSFLDVFGIT
ncbi:Uncharacterised protein [Mycobacterium tuberculosis]|nr:Uncharacterised protein [Mycobacterium tuberculosis]